MTEDGFKDLLWRIQSLASEPMKPEDKTAYIQALDWIPDDAVKVVADEVLRNCIRFPKASQIHRAAKEAGITPRSISGTDYGWQPPPRGSQEMKEGKSRSKLFFALNRGLTSTGVAICKWLDHDGKDVRERAVRGMASGKDADKATAWVRREYREYMQEHTGRA